MTNSFLLGSRVRHSRAALAALTVVVLTAVALPANPAAAVAPVPSAPKPELPASKAAVVVDAGTGAVLSASNDRQPVPVASALKILTALVVHREVEPTDLVPISRRAESMPARKLSVRAGQRWNADGLLHAVLLASANDAAVALAERAGGGTMARFERLLRAEARKLRLQDSPTLQDPAGLDDEFSVGGGNLISARDLAIVARAFLGQPELASTVTLPEYRFIGGDGIQHRVVNHNRFLRSYPGAIGVKTGYTRRSGYTLVAAARRSGHTLIAVVVHSANMVEEASGLLDAGFATLRRHGPVLGYLPSSRVAQTSSADGSAAVKGPTEGPGDRSGAAPVRASAGTPVNPGLSAAGVIQAAMLVLGALGAVVVLRRRQVVRRQELVRRQRARPREHVSGPR